MNHKYDDAAVGNRILKADIETLRAKVINKTSFISPSLRFPNYTYVSNFHVLLLR